MSSVFRTGEESFIKRGFNGSLNLAVSLILLALIIVAALAWNKVIRESIKKYVDPRITADKESTQYQLIYAIIATIVVVIVYMIISQMMGGVPIFPVVGVVS